MLASLRIAARLAVKRLASDPLIAVTTMLTIATAAVLLAAGPIYAAAVAEGALQETVSSATTQQRSIVITQQVPADAIQSTTELIEDEIDHAFAGLRSDRSTRLSSDSFGVEGVVGEDEPPLLASFEHVVDLQRHATLRSGTWPRDGREPLELALTEAAASALNLRVGSTLSLVDRQDPSLRVLTQLSGIIEIDDPSEPLWAGDDLIVLGFRPSDTFPRIGPLFVAEDDLVTRLAARRLTATWQVEPDPTSFTVAELETVQRRIARLETDVNDAFDTQLRPEHEAVSPIGVETQLDRLLGDAERSLAVTDATVYALVLQLSILSGYALTLTASLIVESRIAETHLVRARGAAPSTLLRLSAVEGLLLVLPAVIAAPWVAAGLLELLHRTDVIRSGPLVLDSGLIVSAYVLATIVGLVAILALTVPAHRAARRSEGGQSHRRRESTRTATQRSGLDMAFLALLVIGIWQLNSLGDELAARVQGRFDVDPLLIVVPALGLVAGGIASLRLVPMAARGAERILQRSRSPVPALSAWQVARRPQRYARTSLLLIMAVTVAFFTTSFSSTWTGSQADQATFEIGSDARVSPDRRTGTSLRPLHVVTGYERIEGVATAMPVVRRGRVFRESSVDIFALDAARASDVVRIRSDLGDGFDGLIDELAAMRPTLQAIELPGSPTEMSVVLSTHQEPLPIEEAPPAAEDPSAGSETTDAPPPEPTVEPVPPPDAKARLRVVLRDGDGLLHRIELGDIPMDVTGHRLVASLSSDPGATVPIPTAAPISILSFEVEVLLATGPERTFELSLSAVGARTDAAWSDIAVPEVEYLHGTTRAPSGALPPTVERSTGFFDAGYGLRIETGIGRGAVVTEVRARGTGADDPIGAIVTESFLRESGLSIGERFRWPELDAQADRLEVVGSVAALPTVRHDGGPAIVVDLPSLQVAALDPLSAIDHGDEYWLALEGAPGPVVAELLAAPFHAVEVQPRSSREDQLLNDPVALGAIGALELGIIASAIFAAIGFAISSAVSSRERLREFATLRALGLTPNELGRWLGAEYGALVLVSVLFGTALGFVLARVLLPLISLTQQGDLIYPSVLVDHPWGTIAIADVVILAATMGTTALVIVGLRRSGLGRHLRMGDE